MFAKKSRLKKCREHLLGRNGSMKDAAKQVDLLMRGNMDLCVNIVQVGRQFEVRAIAWQ